MHVLVTRPEPDGIRLKGMIEAAGYDATVVPLMQVELEEIEAEELEGVTSLIATSRNALRALVGTKALEVARHLTVYAVGAATAGEARRMGFQRIVKGPGTAEALAPLIASLVDPAEEVLLHLAGERLAYDLVGELSLMGIKASARTVYRTRAMPALPDDIPGAIELGEFEAVMLMSPQTARIWARLIMKHGLEDAAREMVHLCLSEAVAEPLKALGELDVDVAGRPSLEEMLALVEATAARLAA